MKIRPHPGKSAENKSTSGMALVVTLSLLVLVTIAVMAFFTRATANRMVENSRANQLVARQIAGTASDYVLGSLFGEIPQNASVSGQPGREWYQLTNAVGLLPTRAVATAATGTDFANLIRQSVPSADASASSHNTAAASQNGRLIPAARWNEPRLIFGDGFANADQLPHWIYLNRDGSTTNAPGADVVGRFAYNVYDVSGLLDANIAGHPALDGTNLSSIKSTQAGADLTALPGVEQAAINDLVAFRSPDTTTPTAFVEAVLEWQKSGFLDPTVDVAGASLRKKSFTSRSDLIRYAATQNSGLLPALPFLTHVSISGKAPGVRLDGNDDNVPDDGPVRVSATTMMTRYRDDGSAFTKEVTEGTALPDHRFSLAKLAWLTPGGPAAGISSEAIQACFGLAWNPTERRWDYVGHTGGAVRDELFTLQQIAAQNRYPNFFELLYAAIGRDSMDLALGRYWGQPGASDAATWGIDSGISAYKGTAGFLMDEIPQFQVFSIGASIIDQADEDNFPTTLNFAGIDFYGIEDLPYLSGAFTKLYYNEAGTPEEFGDPPVSAYLIPQLWNPHRTIPNSASPANLRLVFSGDSIMRIQMNIPDPNPSLPHTPAKLRRRESLTFDTPVSFAAETVEFLHQENAFRAAPGILTPDIATGGTLQGGVSPGVPDFTPAIGVLLGNYTDPWPDDMRRNYTYPITSAMFTNDPNTGNLIFDRSTIPITGPPYPGGRNNTELVRSPAVRLELVNVQILAQYFDGSTWKTYQEFPNGNGLITAPIDSPQGGFHIGELYANNFNTRPGRVMIRAMDPRTSRFGFGTTGNTVIPGDNGGPWPVDFYEKSTWQPRNDRALTASMGRNFEAPLSYRYEAYVPGTQPWAYRPPLSRFWWNDDPDFFYSDRDGVIRKADGYLAKSTINPMFVAESGSPTEPGPGERTRPIILQRPFQSVAELGYVFRNQPWKTLDFFTAESADGALLDIFCVNESDSELTAGKINPRSSPQQVIQAIFRATPYDEVFARNPGATDATITDNEAQTLASTFVSGNPNLIDRAGLPALVGGNVLASSTILPKPSREAALRTLNDLTDFHTWRIFADIIIQSGRFSGSAAADRFMVDAEERIWLSTSIDRKTGRVLARETEIP